MGVVLFLVTAVLLVSQAVRLVFSGVGSFAEVAAVFSAVVGAVACGAMLVDAVDLWVRHGQFSAFDRRQIRFLVSVALIAAIATSMLGRTTAVALVMAPSIAVYLFAVRGGVPGSARSRRAAAAPAAAVRTRQRRGGKKHR
jgi:hypothetical protein